MAADAAPLAILGPTGYTGRLVLERARETPLPIRLVGRRRDALDALALPHEEVRVADARDPAALRGAFDGAAVVASLAGPFLANGTAAAEAAIAVGAHYLDTSGEQAFARRVYDELGPRAAEAGVVLLTSFGFDYVPGDLAARLAADGLDEPLDQVVVGYSVKDMAMSSGTRTTVGHVMAQQQVAWEDGSLVGSRFGATTRRMRFPFGDRNVVEWSGTEPLTVPRHIAVRRVRSYVRAPRVAARAGGLGRLASPLVRLAGRIGSGPSAQRRARTEFAVVAEASSGGRRRRATLTGSDVYLLTALLIVRGAELLRSGRASSVGALAPAEAFDARTLAGLVSPPLRPPVVEDF